MFELPTGTVTFLFTDVVGSTRLWEETPEAMRSALVRHDELIEACVAAHDGVVVRPRGEGDSRFAVFARASDAVAAAAACQEALYRETWSTPRPLRVRLALHTGEADVRAGDYYGSAVNRCARLRSIGHGGQALLSLATVELVRDALPANLTLRDLGQHRLKDLIRPEQVYQLQISGLPDDFPPLLSIDQRRHNLPVQQTPLIGRDGEIASVVALLRRSAVRLLTLSGPGGVGKTRLALQVAAELLDDFADGVYFVELAPLTDPELVVSTIAQTLGVRESADRSLLAALKDYSRDKQLLLVLDNFEQVLPAASDITALLATSPHLKVLATSRTVLRVYGEHDYPVPPLSLPVLPPGRSAAAASGGPPAAPFDVGSLSQYESVALFIQRALAVKPDFQMTNANAPAVAEICVRLDGLPLAIELAAARVRVLSPEAILGRLESALGPSSLRLLTGGARDLPARQQTLRSAIDWSFHLLTPEEQRLFRRLAVFAGGFTVTSAEAVANFDDGLDLDPLDGLIALVEKSLVRQPAAADIDPRFDMLQTLREYGLEQLTASGEAAAVRQAHARFFLALLEEAEPELRGPEQSVWLRRLEVEHDNLREVLTWAHAAREWGLALRLAGAMVRLWFLHGHLREGQHWLTTLLPLGNDLPGLDRAKALHGLGMLTYELGDYAQAKPPLTESLALRRALGDRPGTVASLNNLANVAIYEADYGLAAQYYEEALTICQASGDQWGTALILGNIAWVAMARRDYARAAAVSAESLALRRQLRDQWGVGKALTNLAWAALYQDHYQEAQAPATESLAIFESLGDLDNVGDALDILGRVAVGLGDAAQARAYFVRAAAINQELGDRTALALLVFGFASLAVVEGQFEQAARLFATGDTLSSHLGPFQRVYFDRYRAATRAHLDAATYDAADATGRTWTLEQAIATAIQQPAVQQPAVRE